ncbi:MAG TPA: transcriptional repressor LexA [Thermoleophilia bacterium]|nr:transcriptional repressor LexA [Thermoleophilia bacterium]
MDLSDRQRAIVNFIRRYVGRHGYPPTVREIGEAVGLTSPASVHNQLATLERKGYLRRGVGKRRALELVETGSGSSRSSQDAAGRLVPLVGRVAAGEPLLAEENIEEYLSTPEFMSKDENCFALRVRGTSMIGAGILDGDVVIVRRQDGADNGDIVVALLGQEEATLKRFFKEDGHIRLQPENPSFEPILVRDATVVGRVVGVMRRL